MVMSYWDVLITGKSTTFEMRWKSDAPEGWQWVVTACVPRIADDGTITSIWGITTDIAAQKRVEQEAIARAEALEKAREAEALFFRFADVAPVGILVLEPSARISYCNKTWMNMTDHRSVGHVNEVDFASVVHEDYLPALMEEWRSVSVDGIPGSFQTKLKKLWTGSEGEARGHVWAIITVFPELNEDGSVRQVVGALMDISHLKFAENEQQTRIVEALEAKRQQEK